MIGAIIGDICGSTYEFSNYKKKDFELFRRDSFFTDDSILTLALAKTILDTEGDEPVFQDSFVKNMQSFGRRYPDGGYGYLFDEWIYSPNPKPYNSYGNGSGMRVSPVAYMAKSLDEAKKYARLSAEVTHNHPEGIAGAEAVAACIYLALHGATKEEIKEEIQKNYYPYDFGGSFTIDKIRPEYTFYATCKDSVPQAIEAFLEGEDFEDVIRTAISLGGDSDTIAAMAGGIAEAYFGVPEEMKKQALEKLDPFLREIAEEFIQKYVDNV